MIIELMRPLNTDLVVSKKLIGEREETEPRIRISNLGNDLQKQYYDISLPPEQREEIDAQKQRVFSLGHILEQEIFRQLDGVVHDIDKKVYSGISDHLGHEIIGEIDCLFTDAYGTTYVVDVKTMSDNSYNKLIEAQNIKESHYVYYVQLQMYMHFLGLEDSLILAYNKNNSNMAEVFCDYDAEFCKEQLKRIDTLKTHLEAGTVPELEYPNITYYKTRKVRNKEQYEGLGQIIKQPHPLNRYNPYIDTETEVTEMPELKGVIYDERYPTVEETK